MIGSKVEPGNGAFRTTEVETKETVTSNQEASGSKESRLQDRSVRQKTKNWLEENQEWIIAAVFLLQGFDTALELFSRGKEYYE